MSDKYKLLCLEVFFEEARCSYHDDRRNFSGRCTYATDAIYVHRMSSIIRIVLEEHLELGLFWDFFLWKRVKFCIVFLISVHGEHGEPLSVGLSFCFLFFFWGT